MESPLQSLIANAKEKIEFAYAEALSRGKADYAVIVLDLRDRSAQLVANTIAGKQSVDTVRVEAEKRQTVPLLTVAQPRKTILHLLTQVGATFGDDLRQTCPEGMCRVFAVANGVVSQSFMAIPDCS